MAHRTRPTSSILEKLTYFGVFEEEEGDDGDEEDDDDDDDEEDEDINIEGGLMSDGP